MEKKAFLSILPWDILQIYSYIGKIGLSKDIVGIRRDSKEVVHNIFHHVKLGKCLMQRSL